MSKLILADTQYERVLVDTTLEPITGKQYAIKNGHTASITITYGVDTLSLSPDAVAVLIYDGVDWALMTVDVNFAELNPTFDSLTVTDSVVATNIAISLLKDVEIKTDLLLTNNGSYASKVGNYGVGGFEGYLQPYATGWTDLINTVGVGGIRLKTGTGLSQRLSINSSGRIYTGATDNGTDLLQVGPNTNISASIGQARLFSASGVMFLSQYSNNNGTDFCTAQDSAGSSYFNAKLGQILHLMNNNSDVITVSGTAINLLKPTVLSETTPLGTAGTVNLRSYSNSQVSWKGGGAFGYSSASVVLGELGGSAQLGGHLGDLTSWTNLHINATNSTTGDSVIIGSTSDDTVNKLQVNGSAANTTGVWAILSDERIKKDIRDISDPLQKAVDLADCVKHYNYIEEAEMGGASRTQYIAQTLIEKGFGGHVTETVPKNEAIGEILGWEYGDEEIITEIPEELDEEGNVTKEASTEKTTKRVTIKEGDKLLQVENNFTPYLFPAFRELNNKVTLLEEENTALKERLLKIEEYIASM